MLRKLLPALLALVGLGIGAGAGLILRPAPEVPSAEDGADGHTEAKAEHDEAEPEVPPEYVKLSNQFVVPVMQGGKVISLVILSLSLEIEPGTSQDIYAREPKLRDAFLQVLFDHANSGGFQGSFTDGSNLVLLRKALFETASGVMGASVKDVLISDIARQDS
ncbi:MAG: flagellar basal body-associated FliL family protein [Rhodobacteraceae bacterium]|nr:flagellar basal body-associated FliL family protein [Paracoccaceae bacterium]